MALDRVTDIPVRPGRQSDETGASMRPSKHPIALERRKQWWWEPGPVDSFCFCFHLQGGIVVLAGLKTVWHTALLELGGMVGIFLAKVKRDGTISALENAQNQYIAGCEGDSPTLSSYECYEVELAVNHLQNYLRSGDHLGVLISVYGYLKVFCILVGLAGGMAGLWAGCNRNKLAAKLFFLSWPTSLALGIVSWILRGVTEQLDNKDVSGSHLVPSTFTFVSYSIWIFFSVYFMKVSWSYHVVLHNRDKAATSGYNSGVELREVEEGSEGRDV